MISVSIAPRQIRALPMTLWLLFATVLPASPTFACGGIFDVGCNLQHGGMSPGNIAKQTEKAGQDVANAVNELQASLLTGPTLEQAIIASRNTAINGAMPIPPNIRQQLTGYASEDSMNRVRYKIGDNGFVNLAHLLEQGGFASAVTLIDVIVFRGTSEAADPATWAHELTHVDQYASGAHSFAVRYARNWHTIEDPAHAKGNGFWAWSQQNQPFLTSGQQNQVSSPMQPPWQQQAPSGFPPGFGMAACGCYGNGPVVAAEPRCASGAVRINLCYGVCPGGGSPYAWVCQ